LDDRKGQEGESRNSAPGSTLKSVWPEPRRKTNRGKRKGAKGRHRTRKKTWKEGIELGSKKGGGKAGKIVSRKRKGNGDERGWSLGHQSKIKEKETKEGGRSKET